MIVHKSKQKARQNIKWSDKWRQLVELSRWTNGSQGGVEKVKWEISPVVHQQWLPITNYRTHVTGVSLVQEAGCYSCSSKDSVSLREVTEHLRYFLREVTEHLRYLPCLEEHVFIHEAKVSTQLGDGASEHTLLLRLLPCVGVGYVVLQVGLQIGGDRGHVAWCGSRVEGPWGSQGPGGGVGHCCNLQNLMVHIPLSATLVYYL